ncbi:Fic family protein [Maricaulis sp.]|uniref:Fic family protein n=1 Tax=Maricaulis sp. TaxID=1486257 RepID=UPI003A953069
MTLEDRGETIGLMEPLLISETSRHRGALNDLALELATKSAAFKSSLPKEIVSALADLVRSMNCYYSNLIEGHETHPIDIERALQEDYSADPEKRDLQLEAKAHITVQSWIDTGSIAGTESSAASLCEIHRRFCDALPDSLLWVENPDTKEKERVIPGEYRTGYVQVGRHVPVSPGAIPRFMDRFDRAYGALGKSSAIIAAAGAHHRLLWIHPFADGNGRVARLMSHAMLLRSLDTGGLWSVARGLARKVDAYKSHLASCDADRRNDLDGRGTLSEAALSAFTGFFLETCIDQVDFMAGLMQPAALRERVLLWTKNEHDAGRLPAKAGRLMEAILYRGSLPRGELENTLGMADRSGRRVAAELTKAGVLTSQTHKSDLKLAFPARLASAWMPGLFPEKQA